MNTTTEPKEQAGPVVLPVDIRDYFAAKAMVMSFGPADSSITYEEMAKHCYAMADAMLRAREGGAS